MNPLCLLSYAWHRSENQRRVSANNCHSSPLISFISLTWLERHFCPQWTSKLTVTRLAVSSYFFSLRIHAPHMQSKFRVQFRAPHEETWAFPPLRFTYCSRAIIPKLHWHRGDNRGPFILTCTKQEHKTQGSFSHGQFLIFCASQRRTSVPW